jgi:hypothetical protein
METNGKGCAEICLPLTHRVTFKVQLQNQGRFQVPKKIRWYYKLESSQMLEVTLKVFNLGFEEKFLAKMLPDGRITVPRLVIVALKHSLPDLKSSFIEIQLEPA